MSTKKDCVICGSEFTMYTTMDKYCSLGCMKKRSKPISPMSKKRKKELAIYKVKREVFLIKNTKCPITGGTATEIHHTKGRGSFLNREDTWLAVSREGHNKIHDNPDWARENGYIELRR